MSDNSSHESLPNDCSNSIAKAVGTITIIVTKGALLLPLYIFILYLGLQQWRKQRSFTTVSHSDIFTYHLAVFELIWILASGTQLCGVSTAIQKKFLHCLLSIAWFGENFFHVLACVERYLAVVHPIIYMGLRNARGVRIRNISIGCVWLLSSVCSVLNNLYFDPSLPLPFLIPFVFSLLVVSFCSFSVLCVLIRPGPGGGEGDRERVDQVKRRAFFTITAILVLLWLWLGGILVSYALKNTPLLGDDVKCVTQMCAYIFNLPSSFVLPLLYLHRAGKLSFCCQNNG